MRYVLPTIFSSVGLMDGMVRPEYRGESDDDENAAIVQREVRADAFVAALPRDEFVVHETVHHIVTGCLERREIVVVHYFLYVPTISSIFVSAMKIARAPMCPVIATPATVR